MIHMLHTGTKSSQHTPQICTLSCVDFKSQETVVLASRQTGSSLKGDGAH